MQIENKKTIIYIVAVILAVAVLCATTVCLLVKNTNGESNATAEKTTLVVQGAKAKAGDKNVEVIIKVANNPGILGIDYDLYYDDTVMSLVNAKSELDVEGCVYTPPAYFRNPTSFLWDFQDPNWTEDGTFLKLYFDIFDTAPVGEYEIKIMYSYGNIFDADLNPIDVAVKNGKISVN